MMKDLRVSRSPRRAETGVGEREGVKSWLLH